MNEFLLYNQESDAYIAGSYTICGSVLKPGLACSVHGLPKGFVEVKENPLKTWVDFTFACNQIQDYEPDNDGPSCYWNGGIFHYSGYCTMNRNLIRNLNRMGARVKPLSWVTCVDIPLEEAEEFVRYSKQNIPKESPCVYASVMSRPYDGPIVHYTMMECEAQLNQDFVDTLQHADEIWVPSTWNFSTFIESGVKPPIYVMPLGVDIELYSPENNQPAFFSSGVNKLVLLSVLSVQWRKGLDILIKAYCQAFKGTNHTSLVLIARSPVGPNVREAVERLVKESGISNPPHVVVCETKIPEHVMPRFYNSADGFVLFSRGEGWGLPYIEAAACGVPVIGSEHGGQMMFLDPKTSYLVKPDRRIKVDESMKDISPAYVGTVFAEFSNAAIKQAATRLVDWSCDCRLGNDTMAKACRKKVIEFYSWSTSAKNVYNRLSELCNTGN